MFETVENRYTLRRGTFCVFFCLLVNDQIKKSHDWFKLSKADHSHSKFYDKV